MLLLLGGAFYSLSALSSATAWVDHTNEVRLALAQLSNVLVDAETGQRGYLASGEKSFLDPYYAGVSSWRTSFDRLQALTNDNPSQGQRLTELERLIDDRFLLMAETLRHYEASTRGRELAQAMARGKVEMDTVRGILSGLEADEVRLDFIPQHDVAKRKTAAFFVLALGLLAIALVLIFSWVRVRIAEARRELAEERRVSEARERTRSAFLATAGEALVSSLDYAATLATVAQVAVPDLADWCAVDLLEAGAEQPRHLRSRSSVA
ncbi:MAG: CHASE3 domain-containing protein [Polyangiaceae bacterium]